MNEQKNFSWSPVDGFQKVCIFFGLVVVLDYLVFTLVGPHPNLAAAALFGVLTAVLLGWWVLALRQRYTLVVAPEKIELVYRMFFKGRTTAFDTKDIKSFEFLEHTSSVRRSIGGWVGPVTSSKFEIRVWLRDAAMPQTFVRIGGPNRVVYEKVSSILKTSLPSSEKTD